jgi:hypothetical protein
VGTEVETDWHSHEPRNAQGLEETITTFPRASADSTKVICTFGPKSCEDTHLCCLKSPSLLPIFAFDGARSLM